MKSLLTIGHNDLRLFFRDRSALIWLFLIPIGFVYFTSFTNRPSGEPWDARATVLVDNKDEGFMGALFVETLGQQGIRPVGPGEEENEPRRGIRIPGNFTAMVLEKKQVELEFFETQGGKTSMEMTQLAELSLFRSIIAFNGYLVESAIATGGRIPTEASLSRRLETPGLIRLDSSFAGRNPIPVGFNMSLPGMLVMYLLLNLLLFGGASVALDRRMGVLRRISIHPVRRMELLYGKLYGLMILGTIQILVMLAAGQFLFRVNVGDNLLGILLTLLMFCWVASSSGLLLGFLITAEEKVIGIGVGIAIPMAALGGCWWPLEVVPETVRTFSYFTPSAWAMTALHQMITFGSGLDSLIQPLGVLALFGLGTNLLAIRFFRT